MIFNIITLFREIFKSPLKYGIVSRAIKNNKIKINLYSYNDFLKENVRIDDAQYGGDSGMVIAYDKASKVIDKVKENNPNSLIVFLTPKGKLLNNTLALELSKYKNITLVSGRYEGFDQRLVDEYADLELSIGVYVLSGGDLPALTVIDSVSRMIDGVVGKKESVDKDTFQNQLLKNPVYTRPASFRKRKVPNVLISGNHGKISAYNRESSLKLTLDRREDLLERADLSMIEIEKLKKNKIAKTNHNIYLGLVHYPIENRHGDIIKTSLTNLDIQDIARSCKTYGIKKYFITHPVKEQRELAESVINYWENSKDNRTESTKHDAIKLIEVKKSISDTIKAIKLKHKKKPKIVATDARIMHNMVNYPQLKEIIELDDSPFLLLFGTGWGLTKDVLESADYILKPVGSYHNYNHLSVRSAVAIILDRLFGCKF